MLTSSESISQMVVSELFASRQWLPGKLVAPYIAYKARRVGERKDAPLKW